MSFGKTAINSGMTSASEFWGGVNSYSLLYGRGVEEHVSRALGKQGMRGLRAAMTTLNGSTAGDTATATHSQVKGPDGLTESEKLGGLREIETVTDIDRATTAADATYIASMVTRIASTQPATYPTDASGNGGGGKLGA